MVTRFACFSSIAPLLTAAAMVSASTASSRSGPTRRRQRVMEERSSGSRWRNQASPQNAWKYGFSTHWAQTCSSERPLACFSRCSPAIGRVGSPGRPASA